MQPKSRHKAYSIPYLIFFVMAFCGGGILIALLTFFYTGIYDKLYLEKNGVGAVGKLTDKWYEEEYDPEDGSYTVYYFEYFFTDMNGREVKAQKYVDRGLYESLNVGSSIAILYNKDTPKRNILVGNGHYIADSIAGFIVGGVLFLFGIFSAMKEIRKGKMMKRLIEHGVSVQARVTKVKKNQDEDDPMLKVIYQYNDQSGQTFSGKSRTIIDNDKNVFDVGQQINIVYDPDNPKNNYWFEAPDD